MDSGREDGNKSYSPAKQATMHLRVSLTVDCFSFLAKRPLARLFFSQIMQLDSVKERTVLEADHCSEVIKLVFIPKDLTFFDYNIAWPTPHH